MIKSKILVVDDDPEIVQLVSMRLESAGYEIVSASTGAQAVSTALTELPDLIILDIGLPDGDGHSVAMQLLDYSQTVFTPIIYLTARTANSDFNTAVRAGASKYITKPFKSSELLLAVKMLLTGHKRYR